MSLKSLSAQGVRQEDYKYKVSLGYMAEPSENTKTTVRMCGKQFSVLALVCVHASVYTQV